MQQSDNKKQCKFPNKKMEYVILIVLSAALFWLAVRHITILKILGVWDELGYWGVGAYLAGYDWSEVVGQFSAYYSYGYPIWIAVLMRLFKEPEMMYQAAVILNAFFLLIGFLLSYAIGKMTFKNIGQPIVMAAAFISAVYGNTLTQASFAWTETLIYCLVMILIYLFVSAQQNFSWLKTVAIVFVSVYLYTVHQRMVGVLIAGIMTLALVLIQRKVKLRYFVVGVVLIALCMIIVNWIKGDIQQNVWNFSADTPIMNDYSSLISDSTNKFMSLSGIMAIAQAFICRFFYWGCSTFILFFVFVFQISKRFRKDIRSGLRNVSYGNIFLVLAVLGTFGVLSITLANQGSHNAVLYGRYQDVLAGAVIMYGLLYLTEFCKGRKSIIVFQVLCFIILLLIGKAAVENTPIRKDYFVPVSDIELYFWWNGYDKGYDLEGAILAALTAFAILLALWLINGNQAYRLAVLLLIGAFYTVSRVRVSDEMISIVTKENAVYYEIGNTSKDIVEQLGNKEIYFIVDKDYWRSQPLAQTIQFYLYDKKIRCRKNISEVGEGLIIVPVIQEDDGREREVADTTGLVLLRKANLVNYYLKGST